MVGVNTTEDGAEAREKLPMGEWPRPLELVRALPSSPGGRLCKLCRESHPLPRPFRVDELARLWNTLRRTRDSWATTD